MQTLLLISVFCGFLTKDSSVMLFLEWADEGSKCPYREGLGYTSCEVCEGTKFATA